MTDATEHAKEMPTPPPPLDGEQLRRGDTQRAR
jgi:hypothetical protein